MYIDTPSLNNATILLEKSLKQLQRISVEDILFGLLPEQIFNGKQFLTLRNRKHKSFDFEPLQEGDSLNISQNKFQ